MDPNLEKLFEQATDIDFDLRYMAAREMCELIENEEEEVTETNQMKIIDVFIKQLDDDNKEVKGHAIRCLSKCISYISEDGLKKTMDRIFANFSKEDMDIYSTCFKTIANLIDPSLHTLLLENSLPVVIKFIKDSNSSKNCLEESVEILTLLLTKLTSLIQGEKNLIDLVDDINLAKRIYSLGSESNEGLKRMSSHGLGALSIFLNNKSLTSIAENLFKEIQTSDIKVNILKAQTLNNIIKNSKNKIDHKIPVFAPKIFSIITEFLNEEKIDDYSEEHLSQYLVALISIVESYLENSENQILGWIKNNNQRGTLISNFNKGLHYNPNMPSFLEDDDDEDGSEDESEDSEEMSDDEEDENYDDSSWKVRKAVVKALLCCLGLTTSEFSSDVLNKTFNNAVALIPFKDPYVQSNLLDLLLEVYFQVKSIIPDKEKLETIIQQIFENCLKATLKTQEAKVLGLIAKNIQKLVQLSPSFGQKNWEKIYKLSIEQINNKKIHDMDLIGNYLHVLGTCATTAHKANSSQNYLNGQFEDLTKMAMNGINSNNVKGFDLLASIFTSLSNFSNSSLNKENLTSSINTIIGILEGNSEMKIKQRVVMTLGSLIRTRNMLSGSQLNMILDKISGALETEALQFECFKALEGFGNDQTDGPNVSTSLNNLLNILIDLYEKKGSIFQISIVKVFHGVHKDTKNDIKKEIKVRFLNCLSQSINSDNQYLARVVTNFLLEEINSYISLKEIKFVLTNSLQMLKIENLENELLNNIVNIYRAYIRQNTSDTGTIKSIYSQLQNDPNCKPEQASLLLSAIFLESDEQQNFLQDIIDEITLKNSKNICLSLNILGHLGFTRNFAGEGGFINAIMKDTSSAEPMIKKSSIKALAGISLGNPGHFNEFLKQNLLSDVEARLFYFYALNSIFENLGEGQVKKSNQTAILEFLNSLIGKVQENERSAVFGAIGKIMAKNKNLINEKFTEWQEKSDKLNNLLLCVASMNIFKKDIKITDYDIALTFLLNATKNVDFEVKTAAFNAIDVITHFQPEVVTHFNMQFCTNMANSMFFNPDFVTKVVMGAITYKVDKGAPVRKICFTLLQRLLDFEHFSIRPFFDALIAGLYDEEEDVRYLTLKMMKKISKEERRSMLASSTTQPELIEALKKLENLFFKKKKKLEKILKEKARAYQCLQYYVYLITYASRDPDMAKNPEYGVFMEKIEENRAKLEEIIKANEL